MKEISGLSISPEKMVYICLVKFPWCFNVAVKTKDESSFFSFLNKCASCVAITSSLCPLDCQTFSVHFLWFKLKLLLYNDTPECHHVAKNKSQS